MIYRNLFSSSIYFNDINLRRRYKGEMKGEFHDNETGNVTIIQRDGKYFTIINMLRVTPLLYIS